uniref:F-box domain-containing protein n=1 Tax=Parastrongyloides trichosuri TaxID=131310 RepID=A0A0N4ZDQ1_PARTI
MEPCQVMKEALSEDMIAQKIIKHIDDYHDLESLALLNKFWYEEIMKMKVPDVIVKIPNTFELNYSCQFVDQLVGSFCEEIERYKFLEEEIENIKLYDKENLSLTKTIIISYAFDVRDKNNNLLSLEKLGRDGAEFINKLFEYFDNAERIQLVNNSSENENGLISFILRELKNPKIKEIKGIDMMSLSTYYSFIDTNDSKDIFIDMINLKEISLIENKEQNVTNDVVEIFAKTIIDKNIVVKLKIYFNDNNIDFFQSLVNYTDESSISFGVILPEEMTYVDFEIITNRLSDKECKRITSLSITCPTLQIIERFEKFVFKLVELRSLSLVIMFNNEDSRVFNDMIKGNGHFEYIKEHFFLIDLEKNVNIKEISINFNDTRSMFSKQQLNDREMAKYYIIKSIISSALGVETLYLSNIQQTDKLSSVLGDENLKLNSLVLRDVKLSNRCINEIKNLKFLYLSPPDLIAIPKFIELLVVEMKKGTYMCGVDSCQRIRPLSLEEMERKLIKRYKFKYSMKIVSENEDIYFLFFNNPLLLKKYLKINDIVI